MSEKVNQNREILKKWFEVVNTGDWNKIQPALMVIATKDYLLHDPSLTNGVQTFAENADAFERDFPNMSNIKFILEDCFGEGDRLAARATLEWVDKNTNEKMKRLFILISRFEGDKIAEEWQITAPVTS